MRQKPWSEPLPRKPDESQRPAESKRDSGPPDRERSTALSIIALLAAVAIVAVLAAVL